LRYGSAEAQARAILQYERNYPDREIGVLVYRNADQGRLLQHLQGKTVNPIQGYASGGDWPAVDFGKPGIRLLNHKSSKGLEFDTVFLPFLDEWRPPPDSVSSRMTMYVLTPRARTDLRMLYSANELPMMVRAIPTTLYQCRAIGN
jgi:superfamily I DNA/RNA helicase